MRTVILDVETTGTNPDHDRVIEVGAVLFDLDHVSVVHCFSTIVRSDTNEAESVNGIPVGLLRSELAPVGISAWGPIEAMCETADVIAAHNASFDASITPSKIRMRLPWVCTMEDFVWPRQSSKSLTAICLAHGVGVSHAHRALTDCMLIARLLERVAEMGGDLPAMFARAMRPKVRVVAMVSFAENQLAKDAGFRWDPNARHWWRSMPDEDRAALGFQSKVVA